MAAGLVPRTTDRAAPDTGLAIIRTEDNTMATAIVTTPAPRTQELDVEIGVCDRDDSRPAAPSNSPATNEARTTTSSEWFHDVPTSLRTTARMPNAATRHSWKSEARRCRTARTSARTTNGVRRAHGTAPTGNHPRAVRERDTPFPSSPEKVSART